MSRFLYGTRLAMRAFGLGASLALAACASAPPPPPEPVIDGVRASQIVPGYGRIEDGDYVLPAVPPGYLEGVNRRATVVYRGDAEPGTIEVDPYAKFLYWVEPGGTAIRYPIAVGREGRGIGGSFTIRRKAEWPGWTPTANMLRREPEIYGPYREGVPGGPESPLGARALYLYRGGADSYYRIHGTNDLSSIGNSGSAGCIRLFNHDAVDLFERVPEGTRVVIRSREDSLRIEGPLMVERGVQLPPFYTGEGQRPPVPQAMVPEAYYGSPEAQSGVSYIPDATDIYGEDGFVTGVAPASVPAIGAVTPILSDAEILAPQGGVEMVGAGFAPSPI
ncbi:L,D-transpeptidase [Rubellimicrobium roseum]|uniref:L,D-transpeptidase n=1 Tax=Rubellimicrobium roseum TaxID=687525 RepID=A0A5C4NJY5_9RHOB|nr:L,D-transpeptidase [Rubellimicrobium roseum]TNC74913.1 L,D-transpeptidase [Rubellimicrobium roseum]